MGEGRKKHRMFMKPRYTSPYFTLSDLPIAAASPVEISDSEIKKQVEELNTRILPTHKSDFCKKFAISESDLNVLEERKIITAFKKS